MPYGGAQNAASINAIANGVINGDMSISQVSPVNTDTAATNPGVNGVWYNTDMCGIANQNNYPGAGNLVDSQRADHPILGVNGYSKSLSTGASAYAAPAAADAYYAFTSIEGANFQPFVSQTAILNFWVKSPKTGIHCVSFTNNVDRSYVAEYIVAQANTWQQFSIGIVFNFAGGTWNYTTGLGLRIIFPLAAGSNYRTGANAWQNGVFYATANQQNLLDTANNTFRITDIQLTQGLTITAFQRQPFNQALIFCQRYYSQSFPYRTAPASNLGLGGSIEWGSLIAGYNQVGTAAGQMPFPAVPGEVSPFLPFPVEMRTTPTVQIYAPLVVSGGGNVYNHWARITPNALSVQASVNGGGFALVPNITPVYDLCVGDRLCMHYAANARI